MSLLNGFQRFNTSVGSSSAALCMKSTLKIIFEVYVNNFKTAYVQIMLECYFMQK